MIRRPHLVVAVLALVVLLGGCRGDAGQSAPAPTPTASLPGSSASASATSPTSTIPAGAIGLPPIRRRQLDLADTSARLRVVNVWTFEGVAAPVDLYWGADADTGVFAATIEPGAVSEELTVQDVKQSSLGDGVRIAVLVAGTIDSSHILFSSSDPWAESERRVLVVATGAGPQARTSWLAAGATANATGGGAVVHVSSLGLQHLVGRDFVEPGAAGRCLSPDRSRPASGGLSVPYPIAPGPVELVLYEGGGECTRPLGPPVRAQMAVGERYALIAWGATERSRQGLLVRL